VTTAEATTIMTDVALGRRPHNRAQLKEALSVLEPASAAPKKPAKKKSLKTDS